MAASAAVEAPNAKAASTIVVPMALQAFVVSGDFSSTRYQVAPLVQPDFAALRPHKGEISHDLMDQLDMSFWRLQARYNPRFVDVRTGRVRPDRTGVYLSWCLPRLYRTGIAATGSAVASEEAQKAHDDKRVRSGYSKARKSKKDVDVCMPTQLPTLSSARRSQAPLVNSPASSVRSRTVGSSSGRVGRGVCQAWRGSSRATA